MAPSSKDSLTKEPRTNVSSGTIDKPNPPRLTRSFSAPTPTPTKEADVSWLDKLRTRRAPEEPGKEKWRDATLSEKERWKQWHKAKDRERQAGMTATYFTDFYRPKNGGLAWWVGLFGNP